MLGHLSDGTMTDLIEAEGTPEQQAHLASCAACRSRLDDARAALEAASKVDVPEPPGLYWEALRRNVSRRIAEEPERRARWGWLAPLAAAAAVVVVVVVSVGERPPTPTSVAPTLPAWSALPPVEEDDNLAVVTGFAEEEAAVADWEEGRGLAAFVAALSDEESEALAVALRVEQQEGEL
jgi:hypothetical protein